MTRNTLSAALLCLLAPALACSAERLNVKTGMWEITSAMQYNGGMPISKELRQTLTAEQLAKMKADLKAEAAKGPIRDTSRECITEKDLENPFKSSDSQDCKQTFVKGTRTTQEARIVCAGEYKGAGIFRISTPTPEAMNGTLELTMGEGADTFVMKGTLSGRWLSADCDEEDEGEIDSENDEPADDIEE